MIEPTRGLSARRGWGLASLAFVLVLVFAPYGLEADPPERGASSRRWDQLALERVNAPPLGLP